MYVSFKWKDLFIIDLFLALHDIIVFGHLQDCMASQFLYSQDTFV